MKESELKAELKSISARGQEALLEISAKIAQQQAKIDELEASIIDPSVTDQETLAILNDLSAVTDQLANIVPDAPAPTPSPTPAPTPTPTPPASS